MVDIVCTCCKEVTKHEGKGLCKPCYMKDYRSKNKDRLNEQLKSYRAKNKERVREWRKRYNSSEKGRKSDRIRQRRYRQSGKAAIRQARYRETHPLKTAEYSDRYRRKHPERHAAKQGKRRAAKLQATPIWATWEFEDFVLQEAYDLAKVRSIETGVAWHVDHQVPLKGNKVCGLHCAANVQVILAVENIRKSNHFEV